MTYKKFIFLTLFTFIFGILASLNSVKAASILIDASIDTSSGCSIYDANLLINSRGTLPSGDCTVSGSWTSGLDIIEFDRSLDGVPIEITSGSLVFRESVQISGNGIENTIISGRDTNFFPTFVFESGTSPILENLIIRDGNNEGPGGAIYNNGYLNIRNVEINNNSANIGGGIYNRSLIFINESKIINNHSFHDGGGIFSESSELLSIKNSFINNNSASAEGGGILNLGNIEIYKTQLSHNSALTGSGLIISNTSSQTAKIYDSEISYNGNADTLVGGGIYHVGGLVTIQNSTITENKSQNDSAGIFSNGGIHFIHSTIANNFGIDLEPGLLLHSTIMFPTIFESSIISNNGNEQNCSNFTTGTITSFGNNFVWTDGNPGDTSCDLINGYSLPLDNGDRVSENPQLSNLRFNGGTTRTMALDFSSPAIDTNTECYLINDQRGEARPSGIGCDSGAYEYQFSGCSNIGSGSSVGNIHFQAIISDFYCRQIVPFEFADFDILRNLDLEIIDVPFGPDGDVETYLSVIDENQLPDNLDLVSPEDLLNFLNENQVDVENLGKNLNEKGLNILPQYGNFKITENGFEYFSNENFNRDSMLFGLTDGEIMYASFLVIDNPETN